MYESTENLGLSALFPLELHLGVVAGVATPALADRVAQLAVEFSQRQVLSVLREAHHVCWGVPTLRKVTRTMAEAMSPFRQQALVEQVLTWLQQASDEGGPRRIVLSAGRDGVMLPIRGLQKYKEAAVATLSVFNRSGKRLGTVYLGQMPEAGQVALSHELTAQPILDIRVIALSGLWLPVRTAMLESQHCTHLQTPSHWIETSRQNAA
jgi:hypothetical protein